MNTPHTGRKNGHSDQPFSQVPKAHGPHGRGDRQQGQRKAYADRRLGCLSRHPGRGSRRLGSDKPGGDVGGERGQLPTGAGGQRGILGRNGPRNGAGVACGSWLTA